MKKVVIVFILILVLIALLVLGLKICKNWGNKAQVLDYEYTVVSRYDTSCADSTDCTSFYVSYPVFSKKRTSNAAIDRLNDEVYDLVDSDGMTLEVVADGFFDDYEKYLEQRRKIALEENDSTMLSYVSAWYFSAECAVVVNAPTMVVVRMDYSRYEGGAHGMYGSLYGNYDVASGKGYSLYDVFTDTVALAQRITEKFIERYQVDDQVPLWDQGYFVDDEDVLPIAENFALLPQGVLFYYNVYEIAAYAAGPQYVIMSYEELKDIMRFIPDFEKAEVFSSDL